MNKPRPPLHGGNRKRVAKNSLALLAAKLFDLSFGLLNIAIIARYLGADNFGRYAYIMAVGALSLPLVDLGLRKIVIREIAKATDQAAEYLGSALLLRGLVTGLILLAGAAVSFFYRSETFYLIMLAVMGQVMLAYSMVFTGVFNAFERMKYETLLTAVRKIISLVLLLLAVWFDWRIPGILAAALIANLIGSSWGYFITKKEFITEKLKVNWKTCRYLLKEAVPLGLYVFMLVLFYKIDILFLKLFRGNYEIGLYQAASQFVIMWSMIPMAVVSSLFPSFARLADMDRGKFEASYRKALKYLLIIGLTIVLASFCLADEIILLIYGRNFLAAATAMRILIWSLLMVFFNLLLSMILTSLGKQVYNTKAVFVCISVNTALDYLLVPRFGIIGACSATLFSYVALFLLTFHYANRFVFPVGLLDLIWKPAVSALVPLGIMVLVKGNALLTVVPYLMVYFLMLFGLKVLSTDDFLHFKKIFVRT